MPHIEINVVAASAGALAGTVGDAVTYVRFVRFDPDFLENVEAVRITNNSGLLWDRFVQSLKSPITYSESKAKLEELDAVQGKGVWSIFE
jgi:hypothetical protein